MPRSKLSFVDLLQHDTFRKMKKVCIIFMILIFLFILVYSANFYFLSRLSSSINNSSKSKALTDPNAQPDSKFTGSLDETNIKQIFKIKNPKFDQIKNKIIKSFTLCAKSTNFSDIWDEANRVS